MSGYFIRQVDGMAHADLLHRMNGLDPIFPPLQSRHLSHGLWWIAETARATIAFAGLVPMTPFDGYGFLKRAYVVPHWRGHGIQREFLQLREDAARKIGMTHLVCDVGGISLASQHNMMRSGYTEVFPEQPWGPPGSIYFKKRIA